VRRIARALLPVVGLAGAFATWWVASDGSTSLYFPPLRDIVRAVSENWLFERVGSDLTPSLVRFAWGFLGATVLGVSIGVLLGTTPRLHRVLQPQLEFLRSTPPVLLLPPSVLLLGTGSGMKIFVIVLGSIWPIILVTIAGVRSADAVAVDMGKVFGLGRRARMTRIVMPGALPSIVAGMRSALPIALVLMVVTELVASTDGIGYFILQSQQTFNITDMWSGVLVLGVIGMALSLTLAWIERRVLSSVSPTSKGSRP
jgi:ABC-type nitrate/sulfonate/bicarbonate transport system permease component